MNIGLHQRAESSINHPVSLDGFLAQEVTRQNPHMEMPATVAGPRMAGVPSAVVHDFKFSGLECGLEALANSSDAFGGHG
jgi:hypothetical protein